MCRAAQVASSFSFQPLHPTCHLCMSVFPFLVCPIFPLGTCGRSLCLRVGSPRCLQTARPYLVVECGYDASTSSWSVIRVRESLEKNTFLPHPTPNTSPCLHGLRPMQAPVVARNNPRSWSPLCVHVTPAACCFSCDPGRSCRLVRIKPEQTSSLSAGKPWRSWWIMLQSQSWCQC